MNEDNKIKEWLMKPIPPAPRNEYQAILERIDKKDKKGHYNLKWGVALGAGFCVGVLLFLILPQIRQNQTQVMAQNTEEVESFLDGAFTEYVSSFEEDETL